MQASSIQQLSRTSAYDALQHVILKLATRPPLPRQAERSDEFKRLVEQALDAYRNYMKAVEEEPQASKSPNSDKSKLRKTLER
jgi:hypothetical protein